LKSNHLWQNLPIFVSHLLTRIMTKAGKDKKNPHDKKQRQSKKPLQVSRTTQLQKSNLQIAFKRHVGRFVELSPQKITEIICCTNLGNHKVMPVAIDLYSKLYF
jgi:hypothetical protein